MRGYHIFRVFIEHLSYLPFVFTSIITASLSVVPSLLTLKIRNLYALSGMSDDTK